MQWLLCYTIYSLQSLDYFKALFVLHRGLVKEMFVLYTFSMQLYMTKILRLVNAPKKKKSFPTSFSSVVLSVPALFGSFLPSCMVSDS